MKTIVFSQTLKQEDQPQVAIVANNQQETLAALTASRGKDICLFGGGSLLVWEFLYRQTRRNGSN
jgi:dihydrofolate reductase